MKSRGYSRHSSSRASPQLLTNFSQTYQRNLPTRLPVIDNGYNDQEAGSTTTHPNCDLVAGACSQQGKRPYQEDEYSIRLCLNQSCPNTASIDGCAETHFIGLFDGHAGGRCSKYVSSCMGNALAEDGQFVSNLPMALKRTYHTVNEQFLKVAERMKLHDGSTGICAVIRDSKLLVANVGDCRCLVISGGKPIQMSIDQKPTNPEEQKRIASLGGTVVYCMGVARVNRVLAVSRAFGNRTLRSVIRPDAEMMQRDLSKEDEYLVMASDGLWDVLKNKDVSDLCNTHTSKGNPKQIADELVHLALARGSMDNVTCVVVHLTEYISTLLTPGTRPKREQGGRMSYTSINKADNSRLNGTLGIAAPLRTTPDNFTANQYLENIASSSKRRVGTTAALPTYEQESETGTISKLSTTSNKQFSQSLGNFGNVADLADGVATSSLAASDKLSLNTSTVDNLRSMQYGSTLPTTNSESPTFTLLKGSHGIESPSPNTMSSIEKQRKSTSSPPSLPGNVGPANDLSVAYRGSSSATTRYQASNTGGVSLPRHFGDKSTRQIQQPQPRSLGGSGTASLK